MSFLTFGLLAWGGLTTAAPHPEPQLSLPPLIPSIPGVTEPLTSNAPPLPILQVPTPPLESPPWEGSEIKPKKIGYFWTGAGDNQHKDFLASYSLDDDTFGTLLRVVDVPSSGNSPHHLGTFQIHPSFSASLHTSIRRI
jgi:selenium-binding protein 1